MEHAYSPILSNLAKACEKQYLSREAELFYKLAEYFDQDPASSPVTDFSGLSAELGSDETRFLEPIRSASTAVADRGALRMATWGGKVGAIQKSVADRFINKGEELLTGDRKSVV